MPKHILAPGIDVIDGIAVLGEVLGYRVVGEHPVSTSGRAPSAVDVAWFGDDGQEFPLMIFEVETRPTNAMAFNPLKVFAVSNEEFEKPLFFFHIVVSRGKHSEKIRLLQEQFGKHNYRNYRMATGDRERLIRDILSQHRRIRNGISIPSLLRGLSGDFWRSTDVEMVLRHIETLDFESRSGNILREYAQLSLADTTFISHFLRYLRQYETRP